MGLKKTATKTEALMSKIVGGKFSQMATYSDLFENTTDIIFLLDIDSLKILECNPAVKQILAVSPDAIQDSKLIDWVDPTAQKITMDYLQLVLERKESNKLFDSIFLTKAGQKITLEISACPLKLADYGEVIQVIAKDVTAARKAAKQLLDANEKLARLSNTDEMTELYNFRYFKQQLKKEHERAARYNGFYSIILCDIDHFKNFNDQNGHLEGDEALKKVAAILKMRSRNTDIVARYGGEEFVVLCPETNVQGANELAEALRMHIEAENFPHGKKQPLGRLTISIGLASFPEHAAKPEELLKASDLALYQSKGNGRNQVSISPLKLLSKIA